MLHKVNLVLRYGRYVFKNNFFYQFKVKAKIVLSSCRFLSYTYASFLYVFCQSFYLTFLKVSVFLWEIYNTFGQI